MKQVRKAGILLLLLLLCAVIFSPAAAAVSSRGEEQVFSYPAESSPESAPQEESGTNVWGIVAWALIGLGIVFILYVLLSAPKRKNGPSPSGLKYRRSPYRKSKKRIAENEYYKYKRDKYNL